MKHKYINETAGTFIVFAETIAWEITDPDYRCDVKNMSTDREFTGLSWDTAQAIIKANQEYLDKLYKILEDY